MDITSINRALSAELPNPKEVLSASNDLENTNSREPAKLLTLEATQSIIHQARDAWLTGNGDAFANLFTADGELIVPGQRWVGRAAIRQAVIDFSAAYSVIKIDIRRIVADGNQSVVEWHWQDTEKATGKRSAADDAIVIDFKAGQITRWREYIDAKTPTAQP
ncbi:nuclear transport factor 2 family protein [Kovacikia minuta CCNUW1]|uniref:nuclear transport factor 2 family protein n=1 Tax=Kovacikia minuta TaxID=2931930 RepID=UPI001CCAF269|nr:SgcJ/EcaC family oxidoreductase [Kovacikia minuta]UBF27067.1 nuclear transport factor 2 family protein [Kovacikia minuta CCNUW1]